MKRIVSPAEVGARIRQVRGELNQTQFAKKIGLSKQTYVSRIERRAVPRPELLVRIARFGGVSVDWLLTGKHSVVKEQSAA